MGDMSTQRLQEEFRNTFKKKLIAEMGRNHAFAEEVDRIYREANLGNEDVVLIDSGYRGTLTYLIAAKHEMENTCKSAFVYMNSVHKDFEGLIPSNKVGRTFAKKVDSQGIPVRVTGLTGRGVWAGKSSVLEQLKYRANIGRLLLTKPVVGDFPQINLVTGETISFPPNFNLDRNRMLELQGRFSAEIQGVTVMQRNGEEILFEKIYYPHEDKVLRTVVEPNQKAGFDTLERKAHSLITIVSANQKGIISLDEAVNLMKSTEAWKVLPKDIGDRFGITFGEVTDEQLRDLIAHDWECFSSKLSCRLTPKSHFDFTSQTISEGIPVKTHTHPNHPGDSLKTNSVDIFAGINLKRALDSSGQAVHLTFSDSGYLIAYSRVKEGLSFAGKIEVESRVVKVTNEGGISETTRTDYYPEEDVSEEVLTFAKKNGPVRINVIQSNPLSNPIGTVYTLEYGDTGIYMSLNKRAFRDSLNAHLHVPKELVGSIDAGRASVNLGKKFKELLDYGAFSVKGYKTIHFETPNENLARHIQGKFPQLQECNVNFVESCFVRTVYWFETGTGGGRVRDFTLSTTPHPVGD